MNFKKTIFFIAFFAVSIAFFGSHAPSAGAATAQELQAAIDQLLSQITELQLQLEQLQSQGAEITAPWCYDFQNQLRLGDTGEEVKALQTVLEKEGLFTAGATGNFGPLTFQAVVKFQEKYEQEVLAPFGITQGTGFVGRTTRARLNELYGCKEEMPAAPAVKEPTAELKVGPAPLEPAPAPEPSSTPEPPPIPSITVTSPNGGEQWDVAKTYSITWKSQSVSVVSISLRKGLELDRVIVSNYSNENSYAWTVPTDVRLASEYAIRVVDTNDAKVYDDSDGSWTLKIDTAAPVLSNGMPTGTLPTGTMETPLSLQTDEIATCRYSDKTAKDYYSMIDTFAATNSTTHTTPLGGLRDGNSYTYYVKCLDAAGNRNFLDFNITFQIGR